MYAHVFLKSITSYEGHSYQIVFNSEELPKIEEEEENTGEPVEASPPDKVILCSAGVQTEVERVEVSTQSVTVTLSSAAAQTRVQERREETSQTRVVHLKERSAQTHREDRVKIINWEKDPELDTMATQIQAGFRGMQARELLKREEEEAREASLRRNKEIEKNLGIDLSDPEIIRATTRLQAGFRGFHARQLLKRPLTPAIFISKPEDSKSETEESEYSYTYEDQYEEEEDEDSELSSRPSSPPTAVQDYPLTIAGFRATFGLR